jgi:hypothetical protein
MLVLQAKLRADVLPRPPPARPGEVNLWSLASRVLWYCHVVRPCDITLHSQAQSEYRFRLAQKEEEADKWRQEVSDSGLALATCAYVSILYSSVKMKAFLRRTQYLPPMCSSVGPLAGRAVAGAACDGAGHAACGQRAAHERHAGAVVCSGARHWGCMETQRCSWYCSLRSCSRPVELS